MIDSTLFITTLIVALTQVLKFAHPAVSGIITILCAVVVGILVAVFALPLGVAHITIAQGILDGLAAVGIHTLASKVGGQ